jgi:1,4-dihydroxy-2-naphthoate octaprenyltransferase
MMTIHDWDELELKTKGYKVSAVLFTLTLIAIVVLFILEYYALVSILSIWAGPTLAPAFTQYFINQQRKEYNKKVRAINERHKKERELYNAN